MEYQAVAGVTILCGVLGGVYKNALPGDNKWIPTITLLTGGALGALAHFCGMEGFPQTDLISAILVGISSGGLSTAGHQVIKQTETHGEREIDG